MGEIIFCLFIFISIIVFAEKAKRKDKQTRDKQGYSVQQRQTNSQIPQNLMHQQFGSTMQQPIAKQQPIKQQPIKQQPVTQQAATKTVSQQPAVKKEQSTVAYLAEKAKHEQNERMQTEFNERKAMQGNAMMGIRIPDSGIVPNGCYVRNCPYCRAENVLNGKMRGVVLCYFCHTKLV